MEGTRITLYLTPQFKFWTGGQKQAVLLTNFTCPIISEKKWEGRGNRFGQVDDDIEMIVNYEFLF